MLSPAPANGRQTHSMHWIHARRPPPPHPSPFPRSTWGAAWSPPPCRSAPPRSARLYSCETAAAAASTSRCLTSPCRRPSGPCRSASETLRSPTAGPAAGLSESAAALRAPVDTARPRAHAAAACSAAPFRSARCAGARHLSAVPLPRADCSAAARAVACLLTLGAVITRGRATLLPPATRASTGTPSSSARNWPPAQPLCS